MKLRVLAWMLALMLALTPVLAMAEGDGTEPPSSDQPAAGEPTAETSAEPTAQTTAVPEQPSTQPTQAPTATPSAKPTEAPTSEPVIGEALSIDTVSVYYGMEKSYGMGYVPWVTNDKAIIILPLKGSTLGQKIRVTPELSTDGPYVYGNYQFDVVKARVKAKDDALHDVFLVRLELPLKTPRYNGTYPIPFTIDYVAADGSQMQQTFTVQLTIKDGKTQSSGGGGGQSSVRKPVILVETVTIAPQEVSGGDTVSFKLSLKNVGNRDAKNIRISAVPESEALTLKTDLNAQFLEKLAAGDTFDADFSLYVMPGAPEGDVVVQTTVTYEDAYGGSYTEEGKYRVRITQPKVEIIDCVYNDVVGGGEDFSATLTIQNTGTRDAKDVLVRYTSEDEAIRKKGVTDSVSIGTLKKGETTTVTFDLRALPSASEGRHGVEFLCSYADTESTGKYADSTRYELTVYQKASIGYDEVKLPESITSGETFTLPICVYNTGFSPLYNVRGVLSVDGLICSSAYLGNIEPQDSMTKDLSVFVTTLSGGSKYGDTWGNFSLYYEDVNGEEQQLFQDLKCTIIEPQQMTDEEKLRQEQEQKDQQTLSQWWISLLVAIAVIIILIAVILIARFARMMRMK